MQTHKNKSKTRQKQKKKHYKNASHTPPSLIWQEISIALPRPRTSGLPGLPTREFATFPSLASPVSLRAAHSLEHREQERVRRARFHTRKITWRICQRDCAMCYETTRKRHCAWGARSYQIQAGYSQHPCDVKLDNMLVTSFCTWLLPPPPHYPR